MLNKKIIDILNISIIFSSSNAIMLRSIFRPIDAMAHIIISPSLQSIGGGSGARYNVIVKMNLVNIDSFLSAVWSNSFLKDIYDRNKINIWERTIITKIVWCFPWLKISIILGFNITIVMMGIRKQLYRKNVIFFIFLPFGFNFRAVHLLWTAPGVVFLSNLLIIV